MRLDKQGEPELLVGLDGHQSRAVDIGIGDRSATLRGRSGSCVSFSHVRAEIISELLIIIVDQVDLLQESLVGTELAREAGDRCVGAVKGVVVVIDEVTEEPILPVLQRSKPQRKSNLANQIEGDRFFHLQTNAGAQNSDRMADEQREVFVSGVPEGIYAPKSGVNDAQDRAERIFAGAVERCVGCAPVEKSARDSGHKLVGNGALRRLPHRGREARRIFPDYARNRVRPDVAQVLAGVVKEREIAIEMIRDQESSRWRSRVL